MTVPSAERVLVGLSGGADSAYAVRLLQNRGYDVTGAVLILHGHAPVAEAERAAAALGIPLVRMDRRAEFEEKVVSYFISEYYGARTPNPCVVCNREIKFRFLLEEADRRGIAYIATGHYARTGFDEKSGRYYLERARDASKDQTYFLWKLEQEHLARLLLPLQEEEKKETVDTARREKLIGTGTKESQELCFIPENDHISFLEKRGAPKPGNFVDRDGAVLGRHDGIVRYTVGQRKGLGIALGRPAYVTAIHPQTGEITLGFAEDNVCGRMTVSDLHFVSADRVGDGSELLVRVRHRAPLVPVTVTCRGNTAVAEFHTPQKLVTPGQSAVFYEGNRVVMGGVIQ